MAIFMDGYLNFLCLFFQYTFAEKYYGCCCGKINKCISSKLENNIENEINLSKIVNTSESTVKSKTDV